MSGSVREQDTPLRIVHVLRAPLGGLFRHVVDLTRGQIERGHAVGLITDSLTGGPMADAVLAELEPRLALGVSRVPIRRNPHWSDLSSLSHVVRRVHHTRPDVLHGHGSKGGVLARLPQLLTPSKERVVAYTPHGGSLNHRPGTPIHRVYMQVERLLKDRTDLLLFESGFIATRYAAFVGKPSRANKVIHNGISAAEFEPVVPDPDATDFVYVGELRSAKGIDTLLAAMERVSASSPRPPTLTLVGSGPDREALDAQAGRLGLARSIIFREAMPARHAFRLGRTLVVPSRAESLPYVVLEAAGACVPMIATNVGGIPEIFGPFRRRLIPCDSVADLAEALLENLEASEQERLGQAQALAGSVRARFSIERMVDSVLQAYREALARPHRLASAPRPAPIALSSR
jgi:glycosyltransferase involved in cell wall biosynthesis